MIYKYRFVIAYLAPNIKTKCYERASTRIVINTSWLSNEVDLEEIF